MKETRIRRGGERLASTFCVLLALACQDDQHSDASISNESGPLCPDCSGVEQTVADAVSSTSNASQIDCCSSIRSSVGLDDPQVVQLGGEQYVGWLERGYEGPFEWKRSWGSSRVTGFEERTQLQLSARVESVDLVEQESLGERGDAYLCENVACDDYLDFNLQVTLATEDGAVSGAGSVVASSKGATDRLSVRTLLPIEGFSGRLELGSEVSAPRQGGVVLYMDVFEGETSGLVEPWIDTFPIESVSRIPLSGSWPVSTCITRGVPIDVDSPLRELERNARDVLGEIVAGVASQVPATWNDGSVTAIGIEVVGEIERACASHSAGMRPMYLTAPIRLQTSDGGLDAEYPAEFIISWTDGGLVNWSWRVDTQVMDGGAVDGLAGRLDLAGEPEVQIQARSLPEYGGLRVVGGDKGQLSYEAITWCAIDSCPAEIQY